MSHTYAPLLEPTNIIELPDALRENVIKINLPPHHPVPGTTTLEEQHRDESVRVFLCHCGSRDQDSLTKVWTEFKKWVGTNKSRDEAKVVADIYAERIAKLTEHGPNYTLTTTLEDIVESLEVIHCRALAIKRRIARVPPWGYMLRMVESLRNTLKDRVRARILEALARLA